MGRISESELEGLKREVSVQRLAEGRGVELRRHGADFLGLCPFHDDHEPSLVISPKKNLWHCLGACDAGGSVIDWVMRAEGVSFRHAVEILRADLPATPSTQKAKYLPKLPAPVEPDASDAQLLAQVVGYYHEALQESSDALSYLERRGLGSNELIEHFRLGFANRTLGYRLPPTARKDGKEIRGRLQDLGVIRGTGHEHFNGSVVVPVFDEEGRVVELYGRKITPNLRKGTPLHLYLPGPHRGLFNLPALHESKEVILCESLIDALTFWTAGFQHVTSSYGIQGFTDEHMAAFKEHGIRRVLIAYDRDEGGDKAAKKLAQRLSAENIEPYRVLFPRGMDANEYALSVQPAAKSLDMALRKAEWTGSGKPPSAAWSVARDPFPEESHGGEDAVAEEEAADGAAKGKTPLPSLAAPAKPQESPPKPREMPATAQETPATVLPASPRLEIPTTVKDHEIVITLGDRRYRVRGFEKNLSYDVLKVNLAAYRGDGFHVDTLDLLASRQRTQFVKQASTELSVEPDLAKRDLGKVLLKLEELQEEQIRKATEPKVKKVTISEAAEQEAREHLASPGLMERTREHLERAGIVRESVNKLVVYLTCVSRKLDRPLAVLVQSSSAAGKSALIDGVLSLMPEEERVQYSAMTGQSLFYMEETSLAHKILAIAEDEGAERARYALKLLQSEGKLSIASTGKDLQTGRLLTHEYHVEGPAAIVTTTTSIELDEEFENRCLVLSVDESREQTEAIHRYQREAETLDGLMAREDRGQIVELHQNVQRLLRPLHVVNRFAEGLRYPSTCTRTRRDHMKYLGLIRAIALLHQHQRKVLTLERNGRELRYIEAQLSDIELANRLASEVLGRSLVELPPQTARLLQLIHEMVSQECRRLQIARSDYRFSRRQVREQVGWGHTQLQMHLRRLEELEYLLVHRGHRGQSYVYELLYNGQGQDGQLFMMGLIDTERLQEIEYDRKKSGLQHKESGPQPKKPGSNRVQIGGLSGGCRDEVSLFDSETYPEIQPSAPKNAHLGHSSKNVMSYPEGSVAAASGGK